ncbi:MAG: hypothetical protein ACP5NO_07410 [Thermoplasmata archaeon]
MLAAPSLRNKNSIYHGILSILLVLIVILSSFAVGLQNLGNHSVAKESVLENMNSLENASLQSGPGSSIKQISKLPLGVSHGPYVGYVKYTLFLSNDTLMNGNPAWNITGTTYNATSDLPYALEYDPINNLIYVFNLVSGVVSVVEPITNNLTF